MAALVVVDVERRAGGGEAISRLDIFPGGATPSVFPAGAPFWIGYGFAPDSDAPEGSGGVDETTRFELDLDGVRVELRSDVRHEAGSVTRKTEHALFSDGLPAGWHTFRGRWYDRGKLLLSSRASVEFVEP